MSTFNRILTYTESVLASATDANVFFGDNQLSALGITALHGICCDPNGNVFVSDPSKHVIVKISPSGYASIFAGQLGVAGNNGDGSFGPTQSLFNKPMGLDCDRNGNIFVADSGNNQIKKITPDRKVALIAGSSNGTNGYSNSYPSKFNNPQDVAIDDSGNLYVADAGNHVVRKIKFGTRSIITVAGNGSAGDVSGYSTSSRLNVPSSVAVNINGEIFIGDSKNYKVKKISRNGYVSTFSGSGVRGGQTGKKNVCQFYDILGVSTDRYSNVFVGDYDEGLGGRVLRLDQDGTSFEVKSHGDIVYKTSGITSNRSRRLYATETQYVDEFYSSSSSSSSVSSDSSFSTLTSLSSLSSFSLPDTSSSSIDSSSSKSLSSLSSNSTSSLSSNSTSSSSSADSSSSKSPSSLSSQSSASSSSKSLSSYSSFSSDSSLSSESSLSSLSQIEVQFPPGVKAYWNFDSNYNDQTGNGYDLSMVNTPTETTGLLGGAYSYGSSNAFNYADNTPFNPLTGSMTFNIWAKTTYVDQAYLAGTTPEAGPYNGWLLMHTGDPIGVNAWMDGGNIVTTVSINDGNWHMVTLVYRDEGNIARLYVDGVEIGSLDVTGATLGGQAGEFTIGHRYLQGASYWQHDLDEAGYWERALSPQEVSNLYNGGSGLSFGEASSSSTSSIDSSSSTSSLSTEVRTSSTSSETSSSSTEIQSSSSTSAALPEDGVRAYWNFDNDANDVSGNAFNLTVSGATATTGLINNGYYFDGTVSPFSKMYADSTGLTNWVETSTFSMSVWIRTSQFPYGGQYPNIMGCMDTGTNEGAGLYFHGDNQAIYFFVQGNNVGISYGYYGYVQPDVWSHIVGTYDGFTMKLYFNGSLFDQFAVSTSVILPASAFVSGLHWSGTEDYGGYTGILDECGLWNRTLTDSDVTALYNGGVGRSMVFP